MFVKLLQKTVIKFVLPLFFWYTHIPFWGVFFFVLPVSTFILFWQTPLPNYMYTFLHTLSYFIHFFLTHTHLFTSSLLLSQHFSYTNPHFLETRVYIKWVKKKIHRPKDDSTVVRTNKYGGSMWSGGTVSGDMHMEIHFRRVAYLHVLEFLAGFKVRGDIEYFHDIFITY